MNKTEFLKRITYNISKRINKVRNIIIKKVLERVLEIISKILIVPPIIFIGTMSVTMLILISMSLFTMNFLPDFVYMIDTRIILGTIGVLISLGFMFLSIIGWPIYIIVLVSGIYFIKSYSL